MVASSYCGDASAGRHIDCPEQFLCIVAIRLCAILKEIFLNSCPFALAMVSTFIHVLYGIMAALLLDFNPLLFIILTNLPDIDIIPDFFRTDYKYHRFLTHNIFVLIIASIIGAVFHSFWLVFAAVGLHLLLDLFNCGIGLFWPFSKKAYTLTPRFCHKGKPLWHYFFYEGYPLFTIVSLALFAVFLLAFFW